MNMKKTFTIGGVHPDENKLTATKPICELGLPKQAVYPLSQHIGAPSVPCVAKGDLVNVGTKIADAGGFMSAVIHSGFSIDHSHLESTLTGILQSFPVHTIAIVSTGSAVYS